MPFFWRKKHQLKPSALTFHSAEQLSTFPSQQNNDNTRSGSSFPDFHRYSASRSGVLRTDRQQQPLHQSSQSQSHSQAQASQEPIPEPASIRRTQTAHLLQDPEPVRPLFYHLHYESMLTRPAPRRPRRPAQATKAPDNEETLVHLVLPSLVHRKRHPWFSGPNPVQVAPLAANDNNRPQSSSATISG